MSKNKLASPNDSLQQSTREPSTRAGDRSSLDATSFSSSRRFLTSSSQIGGGSYKSYLQDFKNRMYADIESTTRKLELEQRRLYKLDKDLGIAEGEYGQKRQRYKISQNAQEDSVQLKKDKVRETERRLEKAIAKLNESTNERQELKKKIDALREERRDLNDVFKQLQRGIATQKDNLKKEKEKINIERTTSDDANQKCRALGRMLDRERRAFKDEAKEKQVACEEESKVQKELEKPRRSMDSGASKSRSKRGAPYMVADEEEAFSEPSMHRRILKLSFLNTIQRRHIKQHLKNIEVFEQAFATIRSSTGISDIEEIVKIFEKLEQHNFSLLTYVNQLNQEIESVEIRNRLLQTQLESHQSGQKQSEKRKETALRDVGLQIDKTKAATEDKRRLNQEAETELEKCRPILWNIVEYLKKEVPTLLEDMSKTGSSYEGEMPPMRTSPPDEHEEQLTPYLQYIEEALLMFRGPDFAENSMKPDIPKTKAQASHLVVMKKPQELPNAQISGDMSDEDEEMGDRPWTRADLMKKAEANLRKNRRQRAAGNKGHSEERRQELGPSDEATSEMVTTRRQAESVGLPPAPPPKEYAASSVASKDSGGDSGSGAVAGTTLSKSPSMTGKLNDGPSGKGSGELGQDEDMGGDRKEPYRNDMWWRQQQGGKKTRR